MSNLEVSNIEEISQDAIIWAEYIEHLLNAELDRGEFVSGVALVIDDIIKETTIKVNNLFNKQLANLRLEMFIEIENFKNSYHMMINQCNGETSNIISNSYHAKKNTNNLNSIIDTAISSNFLSPITLSEDNVEFPELSLDN